CLLGRADQMAGQRPRLKPTVLIEFAEMRHGLLNDPPSNAHTAHQTPIAVDLAVLLANRVAQIHAPSQPPKSQKKIPKVGTTHPNHCQTLRNPLIGFTSAHRKMSKPTPNCASWASVGAGQESPTAWAVGDRPAAGSS